MKPAKTTEPGRINRHDQKVICNTGFCGTDHLQYIYEMECQHCHKHYGANGSDVHERGCPFCKDPRWGQGKPGLDYQKGQVIG